MSKFSKYSSLKTRQECRIIDVVRAHAPCLYIEASSETEKTFLFAPPYYTTGTIFHGNIERARQLWKKEKHFIGYPHYVGQIIPVLLRRLLSRSILGYMEAKRLSIKNYFCFFFKSRCDLRSNLSYSPIDNAYT